VTHAACQVRESANQVSCFWERISDPADIKKISIRTRIDQAGIFVNNAIVTATNDSDPTNNEGNATVSARVRRVMPNILTQQSMLRIQV